MQLWKPLVRTSWCLVVAAAGATATTTTSTKPAFVVSPTAPKYLSRSSSLLLHSAHSSSSSSNNNNENGNGGSMDTAATTTTTTAAATTTTTAVSPLIASLPPLPSNSKRLYLVRHGETDWNRRGLLQGGGYDIELNEAGRRQARHVQTALEGAPLTVIASSHLERACQTADIIARGTPPTIRIIQPKFGEARFGEFEGLAIRGPDCSDQLRQKFNDFNAIMAENKHVPWPGGESVAAVEQRATRGVQQLLSNFDNHRHVCIVAHGRFNKIWLMHVLGLRGKDVLQQGNTCINVLDVADDGTTWKAHVLNYLDHIPNEQDRRPTPS